MIPERKSEALKTPRPVKVGNNKGTAQQPAPEMRRPMELGNFVEVLTIPPRFSCPSVT